MKENERESAVLASSRQIFRRESRRSPHPARKMCSRGRAMSNFEPTSSEAEPILQMQADLASAARVYVWRSTGAEVASAFAGRAIPRGHIRV